MKSARTRASKGNTGRGRLGPSSHKLHSLTRAPESLEANSCSLGARVHDSTRLCRKPGLYFQERTVMGRKKKDWCEVKAFYMSRRRSCYGRSGGYMVRGLWNEWVTEGCTGRPPLPASRPTASSPRLYSSTLVPHDSNRVWVLTEYLRSESGGGKYLKH